MENGLQRAILLQERETLLPSKSRGSAASFYGTVTLVASYSNWGVYRGWGHWECTV